MRRMVVAAGKRTAANGCSPVKRAAKSARCAEAAGVESVAAISQGAGVQFRILGPLEVLKEDAVLSWAVRSSERSWRCWCCTGARSFRLIG